MKKSIWLVLSVVLFLTACSERMPPKEALMANPTEIKITSLDDLDSVFESFEYTPEAWGEAKVIPRLTFESITPAWQKASKNMPIKTKKSIFLRMILPLILVSNENILRERAIVESAELTSPELINIALRYGVIKDKSTTLTAKHQQQMLMRVNMIPPSLALAQAIEESAWGTSRFAVEGNALFGQWDFSENSIKPKQQRSGLGDYGIARFDSPLASVEGYMLNINSTTAYKSLRDLRAQQVEKQEKFSGHLLAGTLINYSERGESYIKGIRHLISYNKLAITDETYLADNNLVHLVY
jgi:Bax protein